jgi:hypothetical protein
MKRKTCKRLIRDRAKLLSKVHRLDKRLVKAGVPRATDVIRSTVRRRSSEVADSIRANNALLQRIVAGNEALNRSPRMDDVQQY